GGANGISSNISSFGSVFVIDNPITEGPQDTSKLLGRLQGVQVNSDRRGANFHMSATLIIENGDALEITGTIRSLFATRKLSVVGGSGRFKYARGKALVNLVSFDGVLLTFKIRVTLRSY
ncbi:hypothetical protein KI387_018090, partial [Taxus chinensis]